MDFRESLLKLSEGVLKAGIGEAATRLLKEEVSSYVSEELVREIAQATVDGLVSPLLRILLKVADSTAVKLEVVLREPFLTGVREAALAHTIDARSSGDIQRRRERLAFADEKLAEAFTIAATLKKQDRTLFYICFLRGLISVQLDSPAFACNEFARCLLFLEPQLARSEKELKSYQDALDSFPPWHPGGMQAQLNLREEVSRLREDSEALQAVAVFSREAILVFSAS